MFYLFIDTCTEKVSVIEYGLNIKMRLDEISWEFISSFHSTMPIMFWTRTKINRNKRRVLQGVGIGVLRSYMLEQIGKLIENQSPWVDYHYPVTYDLDRSGCGEKDILLRYPGPKFYSKPDSVLQNIVVFYLRSLSYVLSSTRFLRCRIVISMIQIDMAFSLHKRMLNSSPCNRIS